MRLKQLNILKASLKWDHRDICAKLNELILRFELPKPFLFWAQRLFSFYKRKKGLLGSRPPQGRRMPGYPMVPLK